MDPLLTFFVTAFVSLFVTLDAVGNVPIFLSITPHSSEAERAAMVRRAALAVFAVLVLFAAFGNFIFKFFGVTIEAFHIVAGLLLLKIALDMMGARPARGRHTPEEDPEGAPREDIPIIPVALPFLRGPGSHSPVLALPRHAAQAPEVVPSFVL